MSCGAAQPILFNPPFGTREGERKGVSKVRGEQRALLYQFDAACACVGAMVSLNDYPFLRIHEEE